MDKEMLEILKRLETKIDQGLNRLETKLDEHTLILRALEHSAQVNKADHDKMSNDIAKIQGNVAGIKKDLSQVELVTANNWADIAKLKSVK
jgi:predicted  nucleic acid-binding Zn-ribbon protein